jgi:polysaccharide deacetylase family protein (PEP-CTERM system associated)
VRAAKQAIEQATGIPVAGYRAPSYSITARSLWALPILVEEGFAYDSSIFPIRHWRYGIPDFVRHPVRLDLGGARELVEFPLTTLRIGPLALPLAGGAYLRFLPGWLFRLGFDHLVRRGAPTVLYLHPWEVDPDQPRQRVAWRVRINHYHNLSRTGPRVRRLLERHAFAPLGEVLAGLAAQGRLPVQRFASDGADAVLSSVRGVPAGNEGAGHG